MSSPAVDILGAVPVFNGGAQFYPNETLKFEFENKTILDTKWLGIYYTPGDEGIIRTGQDFYDFFVLGLVEVPEPSNDTVASIPPPDSSDNSTDTAVPDAAPPLTAWANPAYPDYADVFQPDLGTDAGGFITGYFLNDSSLGVLSIPSFQEYGDAIGTFSVTTDEFLRGSKKAGLKKIGTIRIQHNVPNSS
jgi:hypothetical protein